MMFCRNYRVIFIMFCISFVIIETLAAVNQNSPGARGASVKQAKSVYSGLNDANGGYYDKTKGLKAVSANTTGSGQGNSRGLGLSAWGIIAVILTVIVGGIAAYYVALFYPIVCKKQGKYDIMELSTV